MSCTVIGSTVYHSSFSLCLTVGTHLFKDRTTELILRNDPITTVHTVNAAGDVLNGTLCISKKTTSNTMDDATLHPGWMYMCSDSEYLDSTTLLAWLRYVHMSLCARMER